MRGSNSHKVESSNLLTGIRWPQTLGLVGVLWTFVALLFSVRYGIYQLSHGRQVYWSHIFFFNWNSALIWIILTPPLIYTTHYVFVHSSTWVSALFKHIGLSMVFAPFQTFIFLGLDYIVQNQLALWLKEMSFNKYLEDYFWELSIDAFLSYAVQVGLISGFLLFLERQRSRKVQEQLQQNLYQSRIKNLTYQLQPHFLFNSMQTISNLMHKDIQIADKAISSLSDILRFSLNQLDSDFIKLREEMVMTEKYLKIQQLRFGDKVEYHIHVPPYLFPCKIPALMLQPLVENSIKHGFEQTGQYMKIHIQVKQMDEKLLFEIWDDGKGINMGKSSESTGLGIKNLTDRLSYLYQDAYSFWVDQSSSGTRIQIQIPLQY